MTTSEVVVQVLENQRVLREAILNITDVLDNLNDRLAALESQYVIHNHLKREMAKPYADSRTEGDPV